MEIPTNPANKQNTVETSDNTQALQVVTGMPPTSASGGSAPVSSALRILPPRVVGPVDDPPRRSTFSDTSTEELSPALLGAIHQIVSAAIKEQVVVLARARVATPFDIDTPEEKAEGNIHVPVPPADRRQWAPPSAPQEVPPQWFARFECLQKDLQEVQHQIGGAPDDEIQGVPFSEEIMADELPLNWKESNLPKYDGTTDPQEHLSCFENIALLYRYTAGVKCRVFVNTFTRSAQQWFNQFSSGSIRSFVEFRSLFLHHFASSKRCQKTILSLLSLQQREGESLKEYLQRFNFAALEIPLLHLMH
ncbi:UNVERIFIED_CONTAM: hypothetical protein Sradi_2386500 [Sesamum radiatum]|uniref:Retrotransposon gag domain-containing protein n=1 Tax=Sesamum radiatum TaxID=300843 RepID=A0AAW2T7S2_SESRA